MKLSCFLKSLASPVVYRFSPGEPISTKSGITGITPFFRTIKFTEGDCSLILGKPLGLGDAHDARGRPKCCSKTHRLKANRRLVTHLMYSGVAMPSSEILSGSGMAR